MIRSASRFLQHLPLLVLLVGLAALLPSASIAQDVTLEPIPTTELEGLEPAVREVLQLREAEIVQMLQDPQRDALALAYGEMGFLYHAHDLWEAAMACYRNAAVLAPEDPRWPYAHALAARGLGDLDLAGEQYLASLELLPRNPAGLAGLAEVRLEQNRVELARAYLNHALEITAESPGVLAVLGQVALSEKKYQQAVDYLERALGQRPDANRLHYPLALAYRGLGNLEKAKEHLARKGEVGVRPPDMIRDAIEERKTGERVMLLEGRRAFAAQRYPEAVALFRKALEASEKSIPARVNLASALAMAGDKQGAVSEFEKVLEIDPGNAAALFNLGTMLLDNGQAQEALRFLETAVVSDPSDAEASYKLGQAQESLGNLEQAAKTYAAAVKLAPSNQDAVLDLARTLARLGRHAEVRQRLEEAYRLLPDQGLIAHALAEVLATSPDLSVRDGRKAVSLAQQVAEATGWPDHFATLAEALAEAGECAAAAQVQQQIFEQVRDLPENVAARYQQNLARYQAGPPCRPPAGG